MHFLVFDSAGSIPVTRSKVASLGGLRPPSQGFYYSRGRPPQISMSEGIPAPSRSPGPLSRPRRRLPLRVAFAPGEVRPPLSLPGKASLRSDCCSLRSLSLSSLRLRLVAGRSTSAHRSLWADKNMSGGVVGDVPSGGVTFQACEEAARHGRAIA